MQTEAEIEISLVLYVFKRTGNERKQETNEWFLKPKLSSLPGEWASLTNESLHFFLAASSNHQCLPAGSEACMPS